ncbi:pilus (MSHA type) biogenesis protein MshL [Wenzhouxiangella sp. AB-CW3]|uniref:pilus (MSHA type) biogenesis protein MshL n=1 Tax=Wenzhouxiangella sp. AB-CW3 TaxID=2771012 RepID=UPI00168AE24B|nr:pilus (MSHA type) biogenesis protein MshL [Wenzhouxiangella sp. AB-CW3]QOC22176.1 pilus (MSHA type) biogenesis protein MshL [Wenzhouxiangella sp. AB-CW3]
MNRMTFQTVTVSRMLLTIALVAVATACATPRSLDHLERTEPDTESAPAVAERAAQHSEQLARTVDMLREKIERRRELEETEPVAPAFDPLEAETITLMVDGADISEALRALSEESDLNLIVDPEVYALGQRATMSLDNVSLREALDQILSVYNVHGEVRGNTLRVRLFEEKTYSLDFLNAQSDLQLSAGGNVFGAGTEGGGGGSGMTGGGGGSSALRGDITLNASGGSDTNPYEGVRNALANVLRTSDSDATVISVDESSSSLYLKARPSEVATVDKFIQRLRSVIGRQVFIEAQLIDVRLSDQFEFGIDWNLLRNRFAGTIGGSGGRIGEAAASLPPGDQGLPERGVVLPERALGREGSGGLGGAYQSDNFSAVLNALDSFGHVSVLSNPNIMARNGSPALLNVGTTSRFVSSTSVTDTGTETTAGRTRTEVQTDSVFSGVMVAVVPYLRDDGVIELLIHPMQTEVDEGSLALVDVGGDTRISLPRVNLKGLTTTLQLRDGDMALIGGLIDQSHGTNDTGVPGVSRIGLFGRLFGQRREQSETRELVIALRVHSQ